MRVADCSCSVCVCMWVFVLHLCSRCVQCCERTAIRHLYSGYRTDYNSSISFCAGHSMFLNVLSVPVLFFFLLFSMSARKGRKETIREQCVRVNYIKYNCGAVSFWWFSTEGNTMRIHVWGCWSNVRLHWLICSLNTWWVHFLFCQRGKNTVKTAFNSDVHTWLVQSGKLETVVLRLVAYFSAPHTNIPPNGLQTSIEGIHIFLYNRFLLTCFSLCVFFADIMTLECCFKTNLRHPDCHKAQCLKSVPPPVASGQPIHSKSKAGVQY